MGSNIFFDPNVWHAILREYEKTESNNKDSLEKDTEEAAKELFKVKTIFMNAGFTENESFQIALKIAFPHR